MPGLNSILNLELITDCDIMFHKVVKERKEHRC